MVSLATPEMSVVLASDWPRCPDGQANIIEKLLRNWRQDGRTVATKTNGKINAKERPGHHAVTESHAQGVPLHRSERA